MADAGIKLSYVAAQFRVKAEVSKAHCLHHDSLPVDLLSRARAKMQSVQAQGDIQLYSVYEDRCQALWTAFRTAKDMNLHDVIVFTLAEGVPALEGVKLELAGPDKTIAQLSIDAPVAVVRSWRVEWLAYYVNHVIKQQGGQFQVNPAQVHGTWLKAAAGLKVQAMPLAPLPPPPTPEEKRDKAFLLVANKARQEVTLIIRDFNAFVKANTNQQILDLIDEATQKVASQFGGQYHILKKDVTAALAAAATGPEALGLHLPLVILGASAAPQATNREVFHTDYPGAGKLSVVVSSDRLKASVGAFERSLYDDPTFEASEEWLRNEAKRAGLDVKLSEPYLRDVVKLLKSKESLRGVLLSIGMKSRESKSPYLHSSYLDTPAIDQKQLNDETLNLRNMQQRQIVKAGQLVAEIRYHSQGVVGKDVYGNDLEEATPERLSINIGEGIEERGKGKFYATFDGIPVFERSTIMLSKMMVHKGDVNLRSGNITFNGPVEITGSVDSGAYVEVTGDLKINGSIRGAIVRCGGNLHVQSGIVTGEKGLVIVKNDIKAEFIENSKIQCGGSLSVKKALLNSDVIAGGGISVAATADSLIAGGTISCRHNLRASNLAFKNGSVTNLNVGVDWRAELSVRIREARLQKVLNVQANDRQALREVMGRSKNQMTEKHEARKVHYQNRLVKERSLIEKMEKHLAEAKAQLVFDQDTIVFVTNNVFPNVNVNVGGNPITIKHDMAGVGLLGKKKNGNKIVSIETAQRIEEEAASLDPKLAGHKPS